MLSVVSLELIKMVILFVLSVIIVLFFKCFGLGSVLGYLVVGCLIGLFVFGVI